ncbi:hypothetical protein L917_04918 [Phytophthora nicotianae]|uniref:AWS domain-containing protein n=1 Tax=Phytophthora nicotianae TaxID=4792 RepID=W2LK96_PHYNI|nr:hypothetical protein L917_04918 [Phytophthora nicotianae]
MPGLSASELPPEALHAGDTIEYLSRAFVCGVHRGYRRAVVTAVDGGDDVDFPVTVSTEEPIPTDMMVKKVANCLGNPWHASRQSGRSSALNSTLQPAVAAAYEAVRREREHVPEDIVLETPPSSASSSPITQTNQSHVVAPSTPPRVSTPDAVFAGRSTVSGECSPCEGDSGTSASIPNRHARAKIRDQPKAKRVQWLVPRSRQRRNLAKCAVTRSGSMIYHAKAVKAVKFNKLRNSPEIKKELEILHTKRSTYSDPFPDIGSYDPCKCFGDCFWDTCTNVASVSFCMPQYCKLGAICSNAPRTLSSLKLFDTGRVGLGVYTTTDLDVGDILGEYCGELSELPAVVER